MGEIKYNGRTYSGLIQANGCFVDTENVIVPKTIFSSSGTFTYTATQDCAVRTSIIGNSSGSGFVRVDNEVIFGTYVSANFTLNNVIVFLKKGQVISVNSKTASGVELSYQVYGVQAGSNVTIIPDYASACYSTQEREVGCWVDGKPLYQKTIYTNNATVNNAVTISVSSLNIDSLVDIKGTYDRIVNWLSPPLHMVYCFDGLESNDEQSFIRYDKDDNNILYRIILANNEATSYQAITIRYTKTTDVAGSGQWTPMAQPTHHYSTTEQVIGTWIDGKPLYERSFVKTLSGSPDVNGDSFLVASGISDIDTLVKIDGTVKENNNYAFFGYSGIADANSGWRYSFHLNPDSQLVVWTSNNSQCWIHVANGKAVCTIQYTKTTD